jgi:thiol-disulfide isomerase/thioredoxin
MKVVKFGAVWCSSCLVMKPRWQEIEKELSWLITEEYDFDKDKEIIKKFQITSDKVPTFIFFDKKGKEFFRLQGEPAKDDLIRIILQNRNR